MDRHLVVAGDGVVVADPRAGRHPHGADHAGAGHEVPLRILGADPDLDRVPRRDQLLLRPAQLLAEGDADLRLDEVVVVDLLRDRVLDLQPRVDLHEVEPAVLAAQELDGPRADVARGPAGAHSPVGEAAARRPIDDRRRRLLEDLLVAALQRALPLAEGHAVAVLVEEDLHLDVPRPLEELLDEDRVVAEAGPRFGAGRVEGPRQLLRSADEAHPLAAAAGRGLDDHRVADRRRDRRRLLRVAAEGVGAGEHRHAGGAQRGARGHFVAEQAHRRGGRADEDEPAPPAFRRELGVLGEEAVAGVDRLRAGRARGLEDPLRVEVRLARRRRTDPHRLVGEPHVQRGAVGVGVDGDRADVEVPAGAHHADGDLPAVRDQDLLEQRAVLRPRRGAAFFVTTGCCRASSAAVRPPWRRAAAAPESAGGASRAARSPRPRSRAPRRRRDRRRRRGTPRPWPA